MKPLKYYLLRIIMAFVLFILVWQVMGVFDYVKECATYHNNPEIPQSVDMIVVLTGSARRLPEAFKLMKEKNAQYLLIAGVSHEVKYEDLASKYGWEMDYKNRVILDYASKTTVENAKVTSVYVVEFQVKKLVMVTSVYHMRRAHSLFQKYLKPTGVEIIPYSVLINTIDVNTWWKDKSAPIIFEEYAKFKINRLMEYLF